MKLLEVPEASHSLFKKYFVDDLAPRLVSSPGGDKYFLKIMRDRTTHNLINTNAIGHASLDLQTLFDEGVLAHEFIDFSDQKRFSLLKDECKDDLVLLETNFKSLARLLKENCKAEELFE